MFLHILGYYTGFYVYKKLILVQLQPLFYAYSHLILFQKYPSPSLAKPRYQGFSECQVDCKSLHLARSVAVVLLSSAPQQSHLTFSARPMALLNFDFDSDSD